MKTKFYIAYGSNLNVEQMKQRCPQSKIVGTSVINDYELLFKGSRSGAYLTIEKQKGAEVPVAVWEVTKADETALDFYEGYPTFYYKKPLALTVKAYNSKATRAIDAFVYVMHEERKIDIPSKFYVKTCLDGYRHFGFDASFLKAAYSKSVEEVIKCTIRR